MKKLLLILLSSLLPYFAFSQTDNPLTDNFYTDTKGITSVLRFDGHVNIMQINTSNDNFDILAIDDKEQVLWRSNIAGYALTLGKYKNKIVVFAATEHSKNRGNGNTYKACVIDPANGKTIVEKIIYEDDNQFWEVPKAFISDNYLKFEIRQTTFERKFRFGIEGFMDMELKSWNTALNQTQKLEVIDLNENLEITDTVQPIIIGTYVNTVCNKNGDMFVTWFNGPDIETYRYANKQTSPSSQINADVAFKHSRDDINFGAKIQFVNSEDHPNQLFYSVIYENADKQMEMTLGKLDFDAGTKKAFVKVITKADMKLAIKSFVPVNKKLDDPEVNLSSMDIKKIIKTDDGVLVLLGGSFMRSAYNDPNDVAMIETALVINSFDNQLDPKFQQLFPIEYAHEASFTPNFYDPTYTLSAGYSITKNKLYIVGNNSKLFSNVGVYGVLDIHSGQWDKMDFLTKNGINGHLEGNNIMWYENSFIVPYVKAKGRMSFKYNLSLQQNQY